MVRPLAEVSKVDLLQSRPLESVSADGSHSGGDVELLMVLLFCSILSGMAVMVEGMVNSVISLSAGQM